MSIIILCLGAMVMYCCFVILDNVQERQYLWIMSGADVRQKHAEQGQRQQRSITESLISSYCLLSQ